MTAISSFGAAAGFDLNQLFESNARSATARLGLLDTQAASYTTRLSAYAKVRSALGDLSSASEALTKLDRFEVPTNGDTPATVSALQKFVDAYNAMQGEISEQSGYDRTTRAGGALLGDAAMGGMSRALRSAVSSGDMAKLGLSFGSDGKLALDGAKLKDALKSDPDGVKAALKGTDDAPGLGKIVNDAVTQFTKPGGQLDKAAGQMQGALRDLAGQRSDEAVRAAAVLETYRAKYTQLDMLINGSSVSGSFLSGQLALLRG